MQVPFLLVSDKGSLDLEVISPTGSAYPCSLLLRGVVKQSFAGQPPQHCAYIFDMVTITNDDAVVVVFCMCMSVCVHGCHTASVSLCVCEGAYVSITYKSKASRNRRSESYHIFL